MAPLGDLFVALLGDLAVVLQLAVVPADVLVEVEAWTEAEVESEVKADYLCGLG